MASSPGALTPDVAPRRAVNAIRSFTVPAKLSSTPPAAKAQPEIGSAEGIETLYVHPNASIFKFTASGFGVGSSSSSPGRPQSSSGTLPWATSTERTIAVGQLELYRVPGSVSFLKSGTLLHAVLPKSQCWCVDGVSKFVVRASPETYYRIEVPGETAEDLKLVEGLKETLKKVLSYEKAPCPFARTFTVDLPQETPEPKKKRRRHTEGKVKKWRLDHAYGWKPENWEPGMDEPEEREEASASASGSDGESSSQDETAEETAELNEGMQNVAVSPSARARALQALRSASMSQQPAMPSTPPPKLRPRAQETESMAAEDTTAGATRQDDSGAMTEPTRQDDNIIPIRTFQSIPTDMPPSPPDSSAGLDFSEHRHTLDGGLDIERIVEGDAEDDAVVEHATTGDSVPHDEAVPNDDEEEREGSQTQPSPQIIEVVPHNVEPAPAEPHADDAEVNAGSEDETTSTVHLSPSPSEDRRSVTPPKRRPSSEDPYAAIQARILARRSLSGTTSFYPLHKSPTRESTSSNSSAATIVSNSASRSRRSQEDIATVMARKAYSVILGPPAHLVAIMLKIAARFASGAFGMSGMFYVESPLDSPRKVPGSYHSQLDGETMEAVEVHSEDEREAWEDEEDDFGIPLPSNVRGLRARKGLGAD